ncbi:hypothetical protein AURDEDRAFT_114140 [Auricularia subglabra TFB-10046 SS5]|nr:hypothetical protein AURDEDRAFT_114140 [Auricularia subglabra TFB-10046 SS5]
MAAPFSDEPGEMNRAELVQSPTGTCESTVAGAETVNVDLVPVTPRMSTRYTAQDKFVHQVNHFISPLLFCDPTLPYPGMSGSPPDGWGKYTHPEGAVYYVNYEHHIVTGSDIFNADVMSAIDEARKEIHRRMAAALPEEYIVPHMNEHYKDVVPSSAHWHWGLPEYELFLEVDAESLEEGKVQLKYYCADWERCCIFWLEKDPFEDPPPPNRLSALSLKIDAPASYDQLRLTLQSEFWKNIEYFPGHRDLSPFWLPHLKGILKHAALDRMTSVASTVSTPLAELEGSLNRFPEADDGRDYTNVFVGRHLSQIFFERSFNLYGTPYARMDRTQSRYFEPQLAKPQGVHGLILHLFSFIFIFDEAGSFYRKLCATWVDKTIFIDQWRLLLRDVQKEWKSTGFMATVLLAVNMGFLAINQLGGDGDGSKGGNDLPVVSQVLSVTSTLFSLGSIVSGMILRHQHRALDTELCTAKEANSYMLSYAERGTGLYSAAVLFSMPFGMLLWSLVLFIAGILSFSFMRFSHLISPFIAASTGISILVVATQIWYFYGLEPDRKGSTWTKPPGGPDAGDEERAAKPPPGRRRLARMRTFARKMSRGLSIWSASTAVDSPRSSSDRDSGRGSPSKQDNRLQKARTKSSTLKHGAGDGSNETLHDSPPEHDVKVPPPLRHAPERRSTFYGAWLSLVGNGRQAQDTNMVESPISMTQHTPTTSPILPTIMSSPRFN